MNRRAFLRFLGLASAAAASVQWPAQGRAATAVAKAAPAGPWRMISWAEKEFDYGNQVGFCGLFKNQETGQLARNAVILPQSFIDPPTRKGLRSKARSCAKRVLKAWGDDLNLVPGLADKAVANFDQVLEGHEMRVEVWGEHDEFLGFHYGEPWKDDDYQGYSMLGPWHAFSADGTITETPTPKYWRTVPRDLPDGSWAMRFGGIGRL